MRHLFFKYVWSTVFVLCYGCASYPVNPPLDAIDESTGYRMVNRTLGEKNSDDLFVIISLSGGGTRAAALDYGVFQYLDRIRFGTDNRSLLDEVDIVSSSSGSSLAAAYLGLFGQQAFLDDFADDVLYRKLETALKRRILNPVEWPSLASPNFSRGDLVAEYFDKHLFDGRTFADMRQQRPMIMLNATDIGIGSQFSFVQGYFDLLCSDLSSVSVSRAVTASMAFTPGFTPITLKNYNDGRCAYQTPDWVRGALSAGVEADPVVHEAALNVMSYERIDKRPYIHLLDSGISDNMGIRTPQLAFKVTNHFQKVIDGTIKKLVVIMVDAKPKTYFKGDLSSRPPNALTSIKASASRPLANYSSETVNLIERNLSDTRKLLQEQQDTAKTCNDHARTLCDQLDVDKGCYEKVSANCLDMFGLDQDNPPRNYDIYLVHVTFQSIEDQAERQEFQAIPTKLELPRDQVDQLIEVAPKLFQGDSDFHSMLEDLEARIVD